MIQYRRGNVITNGAKQDAHAVAGRQGRRIAQAVEQRIGDAGVVDEMVSFGAHLDDISFYDGHPSVVRRARV